MYDYDIFRKILYEVAVEQNIKTEEMIRNKEEVFNVNYSEKARNIYDLIVDTRLDSRRINSLLKAFELVIEEPIPPYIDKGRFDWLPLSVVIPLQTLSGHNYRLKDPVMISTTNNRGIKYGLWSLGNFLPSSNLNEWGRLAENCEIKEYIDSIPDRTIISLFEIRLVSTRKEYHLKDKRPWRLNND